MLGLGRLYVLVACVVWLSGCVEPGLVECDNGRVCPAGYSCDTAHGGCALDQQLAACSGKGELETCAFATVSNGVCSSGVCLPAGCGNGVEEGDEKCDDGNQMQGDGCSADCLSTETCGNGVIDVVRGESCDDGNTISGDDCQELCVTPHCGDGTKDVDLNEACDKGDANSQSPNAECRRNCQPRRCGDGVMDADEACDDGNQASDDGCSFDCDSVEVCGNGYIDYVNGELCDDGDSLSHDGCGLCQPELARWELQTATPSFGPRMNVAMAYDAARGEMIAFGGQNTSFAYTDETWAWDGDAWSLRLSVDKPPPRGRAAMAYDSKRRVLILFGGGDIGSVFRNDTWEWNGANWRDVTPLSNNPPGRELHAMVYDAKRDRMVMFGGRGLGLAPRQDTWEWNGSTWTEVTLVSGNPAVRIRHAMAFDPKRGKTVLFGGAGSVDTDDTWEWNGTTWAELTPVSGNPQPREDHALAYDARVGRVVLHAGYASGIGLINDTWEWTGTMWSDMSQTTTSGRYAHAMAYDTTHDVLVMFGGNDFSFSNETWERSQAGWSNVTPAAPSAAVPGGRDSLAVAYDSKRGRIIMHGGDGSSLFDDTWEWNPFERAWRALAQGPVRFAHALAYDPVNDVVLMFGGHDGNDATNQTWAFNGVSWNNVTPASGNPAPRYYASLAYDPVRNRIVMFGGRDGAGVNLGGNVFDDTWEWDGTGWTPVTTGAPSARYGHTMVYDPVRSRMVVYGGLPQTPPLPQPIPDLNEVWERTGTVWSDKSPPATEVSPGSRRFAMMAFNQNRGRVMLFGGWTGNLYANDLWEWNGTTWSVITTATRPSKRFSGGLAFDPLHGGIVLFGGDDGLNRNDTMILRFYNSGPEDGCRGIDGDLDGAVGCADHDCFGICSPMCSPATMTCGASGVRCGDSTCSPLESKRMCPLDCGAPTVECGDYFCDSAETATTCPGDCRP